MKIDLAEMQLRCGGLSRRRSACTPCWVSRIQPGDDELDRDSSKTKVSQLMLVTQQAGMAAKPGPKAIESEACGS